MVEWEGSIKEIKSQKILSGNQESKGWKVKFETSSYISSTIAELISYKENNLPP